MGMACFGCFGSSIAPEEDAAGEDAAGLCEDISIPALDGVPTSPTKKNVRMVSGLVGAQQRNGAASRHGSKLAPGRIQDQTDIPGLLSGQLQLQQAIHAAHLASGEPMTAEILASMGFLVHRAAGIHSSVPTSTTKPVAIVGLESVSSLRRLELESSDARSEGHPSTSQACPPSDSAFSLERGRNKLFPIFINGVAKQYFKISTIRDYAQVLRKLLRRDPLLTFALQKAIKNLRTGECKTVSHVTSDPTASSASLYGLRITPCVWVDQDGVSMTALLLEHNVPYNPEDVMPRLLRDYAVLSHVPSMLTLIDFNGIVLYQNAASLDYMGDLSSLSLSIAALGHGGMLTLLFHHEPQHLDALLEEVLAGNYWQQVMQVPSSLKRQFHQSRMALDNDSMTNSGLNTSTRPNLTSSTKQLLIADELEPEFQIDSFTTQGARTKRGAMIGRPLARGQGVLLQQFPSRNNSNQASPPDSNGHVWGASQSPSFQPSSNSAAIPEDSEANSSIALILAGRGGLMSTSFTTPMPTPISFTQPKNSGAQPNRRFMSLVAAAQPTHVGQSFTASVQSVPSEDQERGQSHTEVRAQLASAGPPAAECWHEVSAIPLLDPVLDKQVILLVQSNVSARVELENRLADLTDAQLGMLEQLFPRHVIEYMLSSKSNGSVARNLTQLANSHEMVMVLFTDVVGFTSMSKEVEPSQVMQFLNQLYTVFDDLVDEYDLYKLDTVGDCYIVVAGLIRQDEDGFACTVEDDTKEQRLFHADMMMSFAKAMLKDSKKVLMPHNNEPVSLRVGIHCGPLVSGLVGPKMPKFTLFGDTMNTASRLESTCKPGCVQVSDQFSKLVPHVEWKYMGEVEMKGKGLVETYLWIPSLLDSDDDDSDGESIDLSNVPGGSKAVSMKSATMRSRPYTGSTHRSAGRRQSMAASCVSDHLEPLAAILKNIRGSQTGSRPGSAGSSEGAERLVERESYRNSNGSSKRSSNKGIPGLGIPGMGYS